MGERRQFGRKDKIGAGCSNYMTNNILHLRKLKRGELKQFAQGKANVNEQ